MKMNKKLTLGAFAVVLVTLLFQTPFIQARDNGHRDNSYTLSLKADFTRFHTTQADSNADSEVGDQFTYGGSLARFKKPSQPIGTFGVHFVTTAPGGDALEFLGHGLVVLPDGKISFQMLLVADDWAGDRHGVITGGTGAYRNAGGESIHRTRPNGDEELIFVFSR